MHLQLTKYKVVWPEDLSKGSRSHRVHGTWFQVHQYCSGDIFASCGLVVVHVDSFQLQVGIAVVSTCWVYSMLV